MTMSIDAIDLTVTSLGTMVNVQHGNGYLLGLLGRLVEIRHRLAADGSTPETRIKVEICGGEPGVVVTLTLGPDVQLKGLLT